MGSLSARLQALDQIIRQAGAIAVEARKGMVRELKPDGTVVTNADRVVEEFLRKALPEMVPHAGFWGEEFGFEAENEAGQWLVDPVDGTTNFSFGSPLWGVSIGFAKAGVLEFGAIFLPDLNESYLVEVGGGVFRNGMRLAAIPPAPIQPHEVISTGETLIRRYPNKTFPGNLRLSGAFVIDGSFVACQRFRGMIAINEHLYDVAPAVLLVQELGGEVRYADGSPFEIKPLQQMVNISKPWLLFPARTGFKIEG